MTADHTPHPDAHHDLDDPVQAYADGELTGEQREAFEARLKSEPQLEPELHNKAPDDRSWPQASSHRPCAG